MVTAVDRLPAIRLQPLHNVMCRLFCWVAATTVSSAAQTLPYGIDEREANTSFAVRTSAPSTKMSLRQTFADRVGQLPVALTHAGDGSQRIFWLMKDGLIQVWHTDGDAVFSARYFLVIRDQVNSSHFESGLLSMAFHPNDAGNGRFFVYYTHGEVNSRISEFRVSDINPDSADASCWTSSSTHRATSGASSPSGQMGTCISLSGTGTARTRRVSTWPRIPRSCRARSCGST